MARFLSIDWEQQQLHIVQAATVRGGVRVEQALSWSFPEPLTPASAEGLGKKLRDALKEANVPPAPVLACVGREKVILKELRFPAVPANEEPAVVRFQAAKELTESPEDVIIDYTPMGNATLATAERHAMAVIIRKDVVHGLQGLCKGLGTKLLAVTQRPSAVIGALDRSRQGKVPVGVVEALLVIGPRWADLSILRGQTLQFARSLGVGATLAGEVKRSLTVFNAGSETPVQTLFVASDGDESALIARLQEILGLPVQLLDSFLEGDTVLVDPARRGRFTAAIGLAQLWSEKPELGINFVSPKEPKEERNPRKRQKVLAGVLAAVVLLSLLGFGYTTLDGKKTMEKNMRADLKDKEDIFATLAQESADINALRDWDANNISWIDELYDLTARFPFEKGFHLKDITGKTTAGAPGKKNAKDNFVASVILTGVPPTENSSRPNDLVIEINKTGNMQAKLLHANAQEFQIKVDLVHQAPEKYTTILRVLPGPRDNAAAALAGNNGDDQGDDQ